MEVALVKHLTSCSVLPWHRPRCCTPGSTIASGPELYKSHSLEHCPTVPLLDEINVVEVEAEKKGSFILEKYVLCKGNDPV